MKSAATFILRTASSADIPALEALIEQSVRQLQKDDYSPSQIEASIGSAFGVDHQLISDQTYFVAVLADDPTQLVACGSWSYRSTVCGSDTMAVTHRGTPRNARVLDPATDSARIRAIFVRPAWARQGLGSMVLAHCEAAARTAGFTRFTMGSTLTGVSLYSLKGYIEVSRSTVPLPTGEDLEIVMMDKKI